MFVKLIGKPGISYHKREHFTSLLVTRRKNQLSSKVYRTGPQPWERTNVLDSQRYLLEYKTLSKNVY